VLGTLLLFLMKHGKQDERNHGPVASEMEDTIDDRTDSGTEEEEDSEEWGVHEFDVVTATDLRGPLHRAQMQRDSRHYFMFAYDEVS
jgi:hypothetical protein